MAKRGRKPGFVMSEEHRTKIRNSQILKRLIEFAEGKEGVDMSPAQVTAANGLMDRVFPKLQSIEVTGDEDNPVQHIHKIERRIVRPNASD